ncbi:MAG: ATP-binding protein [Cyanobacteria bacterium HKST-UBA02]|nr:ATP-binding protein [Cyanobacteria bacterium HKST-UBA02]
MTERNRIIITGASGVGKTTLVESLTPLLSLPVIPELGRRLCQEMGYERIGEIPDQEGFKIKVLDAQIRAEKELGSFLSDRSTIDCWVLWQRWNICQAMTYTSEDYYRKAREQASGYTHIIYVPPMFEPVEDSFRWTDRDYQNQIDRLVRTTIYDWELCDRTYTIKSRETAARAQEVLTWLKISSGGDS